MTSGLPDDQYVIVVRQDPREPRVMFAGTRSTVYVSLNGGAQWQPLALKLPGAQVRDIAVDARQGEVAVATRGRAFWILDNLALIEQLARGADLDATTAQLFAPETAWLSHAYGGGNFPVPDSGDNPDYGATVFFNVPHGYKGATPATLSFLDATGKTIRSFTLHLRDKREKKLSPIEIAGLDRDSQVAYGMHRLTAIDPGMNAFQWDLRYAPATEVHGLHLETTDDFSDAMNGPTALPGEYSAEFAYGGKTLKQPLHIALDPRLHSDPYLVALRDAQEHAAEIARLTGLSLGHITSVQQQTPPPQFGPQNRVMLEVDYGPDLSVVGVSPFVGNPQYNQGTTPGMRVYVQGFGTTADDARASVNAYESAVRKAASQFGMSARDVQIEGGMVNSGE